MSECSKQGMYIYYTGMNLQKKKKKDIECPLKNPLYKFMYFTFTTKTYEFSINFMYLTQVSIENF